MFIRPFLEMISCCPFVHKFKRKGAKNAKSEGQSELHSSRRDQKQSEPRTIPQTALRTTSIDSPTSLKPASPATSEYDFYDCQSEFSNSSPAPGVEVFHDPVAAPRSEGWRPLSLFEFIGWGSARSHSQKSAQRRASQERSEEREPPQFHESDSMGNQERSASTTTIDAGQSRVLTAFSNLMHHPKAPSSSLLRQPLLPHGATFEVRHPQWSSDLRWAQRREESCIHAEAVEKWEPADATKYRIRSKRYLKTRVKEECKGAFYEVIHSDLISFGQKQTHVAQLIDLPEDPHFRTPEELAGIAEYGLPRLLIVNMQLPVYQPSLFGACDGPGHSFVFYCVLREHFNPQTFQNQAALGLFQRFIHDCRNQTQYRIKLIPKFINVDEWAQKGPLTSTEHRLVQQFNEKPILTRPYQHFFHEANYFEIDVDVHSWLYVARKAFWALLPRMHEVITEVALLIQGNRPEDLPEHIVAVARVYRVNLSRFRYFPDVLNQLRQPEDSEIENRERLVNGIIA